MPVDTTAAGAAVLEIERFEFAKPDRIEIVGYWSGLRGRRFMRPTLVLKGEGGQKRLLALLEHKPWAAADGEPWTAAFAWHGEVVKFESAELNVGSGIDLVLPSPRMRPGKPRRFRQRVVSRDASREADTPKPREASGIVSDAPKTERAPALRPKDLDPIIAAELPSRDDPEPTLAIEPEPTVAVEPDVAAPAADAAETDAASIAADPDASAAEADAPELDSSAELDSSPELDAARADAERLRGERNGFRRERDQALEKLRSVRAELESERQAREQAVADGRAAERESAATMLAQGAELRAGVERQREIAYLERDDAKTARDEAIADRDKACEERDAATAARKDAERDRKEAFAQRDRAVKLRERAEAARDKALAERDEAFEERDDAVRERDEIVSVHERGLPVHPPKPRFLPDDHEDRSDFEIWAPRGVAIGVLLLFAFIVLRLFAGL